MTLEPDPERAERARRLLRQPAVTFDSAQRAIVADTIQAVSDFRGWALLAANVRTTHVHLVVTADHPAELVMNSYKAWATRRLREADNAPELVWTRHGSTLYLEHESDIERAVAYVIEGQGADLGGIRYGLREPD